MCRYFAGVDVWGLGVFNIYSQINGVNMSSTIEQANQIAEAFSDAAAAHKVDGSTKGKGRVAWHF